MAAEIECSVYILICYLQHCVFRTSQKSAGNVKKDRLDLSTLNESLFTWNHASENNSFASKKAGKQQRKNGRESPELPGINERLGIITLSLSKTSVVSQGQILLLHRFLSHLRLCHSIILSFFS